MEWLKNKALRNAPLGILFATLIIIAAIGLTFATIVFFTTGLQDGLFSENICFKDSCLKTFTEKFGFTLAILNCTGSILGGVATLGGIIVALMSYISTVKSTAVSNHISHLNIFITYIHTEIDKRERLNKQNFDVMRWYNLMYEDSANGNLNISEKYQKFVRSLNSDIEESNSLVANPKHGGYRYKHHQENIKKRFLELGIELHSLPRLDFYEVETQLFSIIANANNSFCREGIVEQVIRRKYI